MLLVGHKMGLKSEKFRKTKPASNALPAVILLEFDKLEFFALLTYQGMTLMDDKVYNQISEKCPHLIKHEFKSDLPHKIVNIFFIEFQITHFAEIKATFHNRTILIRTLVTHGSNVEIILGHEFITRVRGNFLLSDGIFQWVHRNNIVFSPLVDARSVNKKYKDVPPFSRDALRYVSPPTFYHRDMKFCTTKSDQSNEIEEPKSLFPKWCEEQLHQDQEYKIRKMDKKIGLPARKTIYVTGWKVPDMFPIGYYGVALPYREHDRIRICGKHLRRKPIEAYVMEGLRYAFQEALKDEIFHLLVVVDIKVMIKVMKRPKPDEIFKTPLGYHYWRIITDPNYWETLKLVDQFVKIDFKFVSQVDASDKIMNDLRKTLREYISFTVINDEN